MSISKLEYTPFLVPGMTIRCSKRNLNYFLVFYSFMHNPLALLVISLFLFLVNKPHDIFVCVKAAIKEQLILLDRKTMAMDQRPCRTSSLSQETDS